MFAFHPPFLGFALHLNHLPRFMSIAMVSEREDNTYDVDDDISDGLDFGVGDSISNEVDFTQVSEEDQPTLSPSSDVVNLSDMGSAGTEIENNEPPKKKLKLKTTKNDKAAATFTSKKRLEPPLPRPFGVPQNFPQLISTSLENKKLQELVKKWPFLNNERGNKNLEVALRMRMAYLRKPDDMKRGNPSAERTSSKLQRKSLKPAVPVVPLIPEGEDEASLQRHYKKLKDESKKANPSKNVVRELMRRTFPLRRKEVIEGTETLSVIMQSYPALKFPDELLREFDRVMERNCEVEFISKWNSAVPKNLDLASAGGEGIGLQQYLDLYLHDNISDGYRTVLAVGCLVYLLPDVRTKADHTRVITLIEDMVDINYEATLVPTTQPCLIVYISKEDVKDCFLVIEKKVMFKVNVKHSILVLFASFYVFNLDYVCGCANFYLFFESLFLNQKVTGRKPRLTALLADLGL